VNPSEEILEVLLVDDELSTRELLEQFCRSRNLSVTTASDGRAAITALERNPSRFTLVLTDINMPGADGFEVLKTARAGNRSCYVVMITGYATLDSALRAVKEGAYDYLAKPFSLGQLDVMLARIRHLLALETEVRDLRRRLNGRPGATAPVAPQRQQSWAQPAPAAPPPSYPAPAPSYPSAARPQAPELAHRVGTMEDRLGKIEDMLRSALSVR
jgi:DNA-binding NtrC family response regulator